MISRIVNSRGSFEWRQDKLIDIIEKLSEQAAEGNTRNSSTIVTAVRELNLMHGSHAPTTMLNLNLSEDLYIQKLNEITMQLIREKREHKLIEVSHDRT